MALALENGKRGRTNRIAREVVRRLTAKEVMEMRNNPRLPIFDGKYLDSADKAAIAAETAQVVSEILAHGGKVRAVIPRGDGKAAMQHIASGEASKSTPRRKAILHRAKAEAARLLKIRNLFRGKARGYRAHAKWEEYTIPNFMGKGPKKARRRAVPKRKGLTAEQYREAYAATRFADYNAARVAFRHGSAEFDQATHKWTPSPRQAGHLGASGSILMRLTDGKAKLHRTRPERAAARKARKAKGLGKGLKSYIADAKTLGMHTARSRKGVTRDELNRRLAQAAKYNPYYGALALENYGGLALENPFPFVSGVTKEALALYAAGALGHAATGEMVESLIAKVPVAGSFLLDLKVPEMVPWVGGMELDSTVSGAVTGGVLWLGLKMLGDRMYKPEWADYGKALALGSLLAGVAMDVKQSMSSSETHGLALENYGGLALENEGALGDGMAYELGPISARNPSLGGVMSTDTDYGQASLADAYYSGADFSVDEGQALLNGRDAFRARFGHPPHRVDQHGGRWMGPSHLAQTPGHRWGWLVKMVGWDGVRQLAALPPAQRVRVIQQLRDSAMVTFKQLMAEAQVLPEVTPELAPQGAEGVSGAFGAYGATVFAGQGL